MIGLIPFLSKMVYKRLGFGPRGGASRLDIVKISLDAKIQTSVRLVHLIVAFVE